MPPRELPQDRVVTDLVDDDRFRGVEHSLPRGELGTRDVAVGEDLWSVRGIFSEMRLGAGRDIKREIRGRDTKLLFRAPREVIRIGFRGLSG